MKDTKRESQIDRAADLAAHRAAEEQAAHARSAGTVYTPTDWPAIDDAAEAAMLDLDAEPHTEPPTVAQALPVTPAELQRIVGNLARFHDAGLDPVAARWLARTRLRPVPPSRWLPTFAERVRVLSEGLPKSCGTCPYQAGPGKLTPVTWCHHPGARTATLATRALVALDPPPADCPLRHGSEWAEPSPTRPPPK